MDQYVLFLLLGVGTGAIYAGLAMGLVVQFKALGLVNFGYGATVMLAAFQYDELRRTGDVVFPWVGLPSRWHLGDDVASPVAGAIVLVLTALLGLALYFAAFRPLRAASSLAKVVASVGIMISIQAIVIVNFGTGARRPTSILPDESIELFGLALPRDRLWLAALTIATAVALWALFRFTSVGLATRAAAESERGALLSGISPTKVGAISAVLASVMAAAFGIVSSPITGLDPSKFTLFVVPALAAALLGRLSSIGLAAAGGLAIGMLQSELLLFATKPWFPEWARSGAIDAIPFVVIVACLIATGERLPARGSAGGDPSLLSLRRPEGWPAPTVWLLIGGVGIVVTQDQYRVAMISSVIGAIVMLSFVVLSGYVGQISLAQGAVAGVSGFSVSLLATDAGVPFPFAPLLAASIATVAGSLIGIPGLRIRGAQLAVITLSGAVVVERLLFNNPDLTGGIEGAKVPAPSLFGIDLGPRTSEQRPSIAFGMLCLVVLAMVVTAVVTIRRGRLGRRLISVRANERAAAALGMDVVRVKITGYALASFIAGVGGAMMGYQQSSVSVSSFTVFVGLQWLALAYLGGITSVSGAFLAAIMLPGALLQTLLADLWELGDYNLLLSGLAVVVTAVAHPEGIAPAVSNRLAGLRRSHDLANVAIHPLDPNLQG